MPVTVTPASHVDHGLTQEQLDWLLGQFEDADGFFLTTIELPEELGTVPCGIHGPVMGDEPVPDSECRMETRGNREWPTRVCDRQVRQVRQVSIIAGPHGDDPCILYTVFGGPVANQEVGEMERAVEQAEGDEALAAAQAKLAASQEFWAGHALTA